MEEKSKYKNPVNILYLTTDCNFQCEYCYENQRNLEKKNYITNEEIKYFVDDMIKNQKNPSNYYSICLMGGEPFLALEQMRYFMDYLQNFKEYYFAINVITNGSLIHTCLDDIKNWISLQNCFFSLDVSYDGSFQYRRTKSNITEKNMDLLFENNILFGISYTITKESAQNNAYIKDFITIINKYYSNITNKEKQRIRINIDYAGLYTVNKDLFLKKLQEQCLYLYSKFKVSLCQQSCAFCQHCNFSQNGKRYGIPQQGIVEEATFTEKGFNHF